MKRFAMVIILFFALSATQRDAFAQLPGPGNIDWITKWQKLQPATFDESDPNAWMYGDRMYTGLAYDTSRKVVYVVNPSTGRPPRILAFAALSGDTAKQIGGAHGAPVGELYVDTAVVKGGYADFSLYKIDVDDEGRIYACNAVADGDASRMFRIYRWENDTAAPALIYEYQVPSLSGIMGHVFEVVNKRHSIGGQLHDSTRIFVCSLNTLANTTADGELHIIVPDRRLPKQQEFRLAQIIRNPVPNMNMFGGGLATTSNSGHGDLYVGAPGQIIRRIRQFPDTGSMPIVHEAVVVDSVHELGGAPIGGGPMEYLSDSRYGGVYVHMFVGGMQPSSGQPGSPNTNTTVQSFASSLGLIDYWSWTSPMPTPSLGTNAPNLITGNQSWIVDMDFSVYHLPDTSWSYGYPYALIYYLSSNNGIGCFLSRTRIRFPVELSSFTAALDNNAVQLAWSTASETNNYGFYIERSFAGENARAWESIGFVEGHGRDAAQKEYAWSDALTPAHVQSGIIKYRLKQSDFDGTHEYSPVVQVSVRSAPTGLALFQNYPNPFSVSTSISYDVLTAQPVTLTVYNTLGQPMQVMRQDAKQGRNELRISNLKPGMYMVVLQTREGATTRRVVAR